LINGLGTLILYAQTPHTAPVEPWTLLVYSFCVFAYQTLDNIDGKQARKTKNSTPLGMLLDHGCDAFGLIFLCAGVGRIIYFLDEKLYLWIFLVGITFCFYISAWCQYYSNGIMVLGPVNAVDDGIPIVWMLGILTFVFGQQIWINSINIFGTIVPIQNFFAYIVILSGFGIF
jgi:phosphatidylglycerophosphate synthase